MTRYDWFVNVGVIVFGFLVMITGTTVAIQTVAENQERQ
jgi:hypothetical protein